MSRYDGLIIPRSYSEYINKTDAATLSQALQQSGVMDAVPTANSNHPAKSGGIYTALNRLYEFPLKRYTDCNQIIPRSSHVLFAETSLRANNAPNGSNYWYIVAFTLSSTTSYITQIAYGLTGIIKTRYFNGEQWNSWI